MSAEHQPNGGQDQGNRPHAVVIGGGLAGLAAAWRLTKAGWRITLVEKEPAIGGLASSRTIQTEWGEFDVDNGPHRYYSGEQHLIDEVLDLLGDNVCEAQRVSRIFLYNRFFDYPLKGGNVVKSLPKTVLLRAFFDYAAVKIRNIFARKPDDNFENWVVNRFGRKLYKVFFGTYTEKTWGIPCSQISADWAAQRISLLSLWDTVKKTLFKPKNTPRTLVSVFRYPRRGGIGAIGRAYGQKLEEAGQRIVCDAPLRTVHVEDGRARAVTVGKDGNTERIDCDQVINTIPLNNLVKLISPAPAPEVLAAADALKHRSMIFVYLVLDRPKLTDDHWIYLPEQKLITHRLSEFKNFSPDAAPADKTLICAEITCDFEDADWKKSDEELRQIVVDDLTKRIGLIKAEEVLMTFSNRERYAYPIYDLNYRHNRDLLLKCVAETPGLDTTGRQGLFKYNNMDHSIGMGLTVADNVEGRGRDHSEIASEQQYFG